ncbi:MAG: acetyltransferase [Oscillospiraceae bacterium]|nr:acetyltransferase [Oscillospiraceae bacterium]
MKQLVIIGASGHGKVVADIARKNNYENIVFLDDNDDLSECGSYQVVGNVAQFANYDCDMFVAIGNAEIRKKIQKQLEDASKSIVTLIHPNAVVGENVKIGKGTVVMAGAVINPYSSIGKGCIINTCASVDHDNMVADYAHISVGAHLAGSVVVGEATWIGAGATVINNINITDNCMIGAGAVVVKNITEKGVYKGVPAVRN